MQQLLSGKLRGYQNLILKSIYQRFSSTDEKTALIVAPTGSGKTLTFTALVQHYLESAPDLRVLFMINRVQLVHQLEKVLTAHGFRPGIACGSLSRRELDRQFTIASYLSIINVSPPVRYNLIIWDEAHVFAPMLDDSTTPLARWYTAISDINPRLRDIGFTATPYTATSLIYGDSRHFNEITHEVRMKELLAEKHLVPARGYAGASTARFNTKGLKTVAGDYQLTDLQRLAEDSATMAAQVADALTHLNTHNRHCVVWQCVGIEHSEAVASRLREAGESVAVVHSTTDYTDELQEFEAGKRRHLVFVTIVAVGYDHPPIDAIVILRPTKSPVLMVQSIGRALRPSPGKEYALVLDYGNVIASCGPIDYPFIRQRQDLATARKTITDLASELPSVVECTSCGHLQFPPNGIEPTTVCAECGVNLYEQHASSNRERTASALQKKAAKLTSLYSTIEAVAVEHMGFHWKLTAELSYTVRFTYNKRYEEVMHVPAFTGQRDLARMGAYKKLVARMKKIGLVGDSLQAMALSQRILYMPQAILVGDNKVIEVSGWQPVQPDESLPAKQEELSLEHDSRREGSR